MKVKILGIEYEIILEAEEKDYPKLRKVDGYTDFSTKKIVIAKFDADESSLEDLECYSKKVLRHEIIHAMLYESGLDCNSEWARNEEIIDWIAIQFEKMLKIFIELRVIDSIGIDINLYDRTSNNPINDPINSPNVKEAKAYIKIPDVKMPEIKVPTGKDLIETINKSINSINELNRGIQL